MAKKSNVNNLNIVWQGQSWSVISPQGDVLARFPKKTDAERYAASNFDFAHQPHSPTDFSEDGEIPEQYLKRKNEFEDIELLTSTKTKNTQAPITKPQNQNSDWMEMAFGMILFLPIFIPIPFLPILLIVGAGVGIFILANPSIIDFAAKAQTDLGLVLAIGFSISLAILIWFAGYLNRRLMNDFVRSPLRFLSIVAAPLGLYIGVVLCIISIFHPALEIWRTAALTAIWVLMCYLVYQTSTRYGK